MERSPDRSPEVVLCCGFREAHTTTDKGGLRGAYPALPALVGTGRPGLRGVDGSPEWSGPFYT